MQNNSDEKEKNIKKITIRVTQDEAEKIKKKRWKVIFQKTNILNAPHLLKI